jgi:hypothetical protein
MTIGSHTTHTSQVAHMTHCYLTKFKFFLIKQTQCISLIIKNAIHEEIISNLWKLEQELATLAKYEQPNSYVS